MSNEQFISEPARRTPIIADVDVAVVGAGPAGIGAAVAAARAGAKVLLIEQHGCVGGMLTAGGVRNIRQYTDQKKQIVGGVASELAKRIKAAGGTQNDPSSGMYVRQEPEITKFVAQEMVVESGAQLLLYTYLAGAMAGGDQLRGLIVENKSGRGAIRAKVTVDASGDGDVIWHSGAEFEKDERLQPMTLAFSMGGVSCWPEPLTAEGKQIIQKAFDSGAFPIIRRPALFAMWHPGEIYANATRVPGDSTNAWDLTRATIEGRRQVMKLLDWLRQNVPGYEKAYLMDSGEQIGLRESRRLMGLYALTREDVMEYREFPDAIARAAYCIDIHSSGKTTEMTYLEPGRSYGIPYRCLVPKRMNGLLAAGRCLSATHDALGSARVMAICLATGQAAGVAAALSARAGVNPRDLDVPRLQTALREQRVILEG